MKTKEEHLARIREEPGSPDDPFILDAIADALLASDPKNEDNLAFAAACYIRADELRKGGE